MSRSPRLLLSAAFLAVALAVYVFFGLYLLLALILINIVCGVLAPIARTRGWASEGRLTRHLNRPAIVDEAKRALQSAVSPPRARFN